MIKFIMNKAIFLDRDGVINQDFGYVYKIEDFIYIENLHEALLHFQKLGYLLIVVTNQSGINRGYYTNDNFLKLNDFMLTSLEKSKIKISKVYYCPHLPEENCDCRKPKPKMLLDAKYEFDIDMSLSWIIGDKKSDIEAAKNAGIANTILLENGPNTHGAKYKVNSILDTIKIIF